MPRILIRGAGELASGVAVRLFRCGYLVVMTEIAAPLAVRRRVAFSEAVYAGSQLIEEVPAVLISVSDVDWDHRAVGVVVDPDCRCLDRLRPAAVIDARMQKRPPDRLVGFGGLLIGLGPGFTAPQDAHYVIETHREARLGSAVSRGQAAADTGVPGTVAGHSRRRVVKAPAAGRFEPAARIGDLVQEGQLLGTVSGVPVLSPLAGLLRGLVHEKAELFPGIKVADIDPRGARVNPAMVSDKALAVAGGVLEALLAAGILPESGISAGPV